MQGGKHVKRAMWAALTVVMMLLLAACGSDDTTGTEEPATDTAATGGGATDAGGEDGGGGGVAQRDYRFVAVTHGQSSDPFWSVAANGVEAAGQDMGVEVEYQAPGTFDMAAMAQLIDAAVASQPDGLVVSLPDADALGPSVEAAVEAGIPVITMNSGSDDFADLGALVHVGQTEFEAGQLAGERMAEAGVDNALCINQEVGNSALDARCEGFTEGLGGTVEVIPVDLADPTAAQAAVDGALQATEGINGILTLGPTGAAPTLAALEDGGLDIPLATFDISPEVLEGISAGTVLFAIDQAQFLQGYLPIVLLTQYLDTGAIPLGSTSRVILTGPQFVTEENAADVVEFAEAGVR